VQGQMVNRRHTWVICIDGTDWTCSTSSRSLCTSHDDAISNWRLHHHPNLSSAGAHFLVSSSVDASFVVLLLPPPLEEGLFACIEQQDTQGS
jgi:hypothetical protein